MVLGGRDRHELSCSACGAPLHNLKMLRKPKQDKAVSHQPVHHKAKKNKSRDVQSDRDSYKARKTPKKSKKRKSLMSRFLDEAWDAVEDIFD